VTTAWPTSTYPVSLDTFTPSLIDNVDEVIANHQNVPAQALRAVETKLGIDGDPVTGLGGVSFTGAGKSANPGVAGSPTLWVNNSSPGYSLIYTDELGSDYLVTLGSGTLQSAYDAGNTITTVLSRNLNISGGGQLDFRSWDSSVSYGSVVFKAGATMAQGNIIQMISNPTSGGGLSIVSEYNLTIETTTPASGYTSDINITSQGELTLECADGSGSISLLTSNSLGNILLNTAGSANGSITLNAETIGDPAAGGKLSLTSVASTAVDAVAINAAAGGIDIDAAGGIMIDSAGGSGIYLTHSSGSQIQVQGGGALQLTSTLNNAAAIDINATSGGIDIDAVTGFVLDVSSGDIVLNTTGHIEAIGKSLYLQANDTSGTISIDAAGIIDITAAYSSGQYGMLFNSTTGMKFASNGINIKGGSSNVQINGPQDHNDIGTVYIGHNLLDSDIALATNDGGIRLTTYGTGGIVITATGEVTFQDQYLTEGAISLSSTGNTALNTTDQSLVGAINEALTSGTSTTLQDAYDKGQTIAVTAAPLQFTTTGAPVIFAVTNAPLQITSGTGYVYVTPNGANEPLVSMQLTNFYLTATSGVVVASDTSVSITGSAGIALSSSTTYDVTSIGVSTQEYSQLNLNLGNGFFLMADSSSENGLVIDPNSATGVHLFGHSNGFLLENTNNSITIRTQGTTAGSLFLDIRDDIDIHANAGDIIFQDQYLTSAITISEVGVTTLTTTSQSIVGSLNELDAVISSTTLQNVFDNSIVSGEAIIESDTTDFIMRSISYYDPADHYFKIDAYNGYVLRIVGDGAQLHVNDGNTFSIRATDIEFRPSKTSSDYVRMFTYGGDTTLATTEQSIVGAINELNTASGNATSIQNIPVSATTPTDGQLVGYNATTEEWEPTSSGSSTDAESLWGKALEEPAGTLADNNKLYKFIFEQNLTVASEDISQSSWVKTSGITISGTDGIVTPAVAAKYYLVQGAYNSDIGTQSGISMKFKAGTESWALLNFKYVDSGSTTSYLLSYFDVGNQTWGNRDSEITDYLITDLGSGWVQLDLLLDSAYSWGQHRTGVADSDGNLTTTGDGSSVALYLTDVQIWEASSIVEKPVYVTTTSTVNTGTTRAVLATPADITSPLKVRVDTDVAEMPQTGVEYYDGFFAGEQVYAQLFTGTMSGSTEDLATISGAQHVSTEGYIKNATLDTTFLNTYESSVFNSRVWIADGYILRIGVGTGYTSAPYKIWFRYTK
jgi:hypothetical protein